jgi:hypothetical protein
MFKTENNLVMIFLYYQLLSMVFCVVVLVSCLSSCYLTITSYSVGQKDWNTQFFLNFIRNITC